MYEDANLLNIKNKIVCAQDNIHIHTFRDQSSRVHSRAKSVQNRRVISEITGRSKIVALVAYAMSSKAKDRAGFKIFMNLLGKSQ